MGRTTSSRDYLIARCVEILETVDISTAPLADLAALVAFLDALEPRCRPLLRSSETDIPSLHVIR